MGPGIFWFFLLEKTHAHKVPRLRGGGSAGRLSFGRGGGNANLIFMGLGIFPIFIWRKAIGWETGHNTRKATSNKDTEHWYVEAWSIDHLLKLNGGLNSTPTMTGQRFHSTQWKWSRPPWKSKCPSAARPIQQSVIQKGAQGCERRMPQNFLHWFSLSATQVVQSCWARIYIHLHSSTFICMSLHTTFTLICIGSGEGRIVRQESEQCLATSSGDLPRGALT